MGKSRRASFTMRFLGMSLLAVVLAATVQAEDFTKEKIQLGKKKCLCDFSLDVAEKCKGTAKCDKKCSGSGEVEIGGCSFTLVVKKGKGKISKCSCKTATTAPPTTGETPVPMTGSGSGETPVPITGSGSEEPPMPITGSGSGPVPITGSGAPPAGGEGMQCSCKCDCPDGSGECDCDCNCPMTSKAVNCAPGFSKVCPMMGDACPQDMEPICPNNAMSRMAGGAGDGHMADKGCQCVPDFLMDMVMIKPLAPAGRMTAVDRAMTKATILVGKKKCKCSYEMNAKDCKKSKITCDKKCSGKASGVELEDGMYMLDIAVKKGKVSIAKCDVQAAPAPTETGGGSGGMGSGSASGNGGGGMGGIGSRCACVSMGMGGTGPVPPPGSGSGTVPTGSGSGPATLLPPTGSGSGSGSGPTVAPPTGTTLPNPGSAAVELTLSLDQTWSQEPAGYTRTAFVTVPATTAGQKVPVVFHLHGNGGQGNTIPVGSWLGDDCIIVAPNGYERSWNVYTEKSKADDVSFIIDLIAKIGAEIPAADMNNVNIIGTSNGAALTYRMLIETGADRPFRRAFPMVSSLISPQYHDDQFWASPTLSEAGVTNVYDTAIVPVFADGFEYAHFHGTEDGALKYEGQSPGPGFLGGADVIAAQKTDYLWAKAMGFTGAQLADSAGVSIGSTDKPVEEYLYLDGRVRHYKLVGEGHGTNVGHTKVQEIVRGMVLG